jgi:hypothetical protein
MALRGPAGNYLIESASDLSNSTNWQPILFIPARIRRSITFSPTRQRPISTSGFIAQ